MLDFFRRHQRYFYVVITVVIVISFSFFGTYSSMSNSPFREQIAFTTVNGTNVTRHELDEMVLFIGTDAYDKLLFGGAWGPNFLNDGVIKNDFLSTGLAVELSNTYVNELKPDLIARTDKERRFSLYTNPQAPFIGVESAWKTFAPEMLSYYHALRIIQDPTSQDALQARIGLFLMERQFPSALLRQILRYQEKQFSWLAPDRNLEYLDLSLFGYHTVEDWFGSRFVRVIAQFIMNAAEVAEQKGYVVTRAEALSDLMNNAEQSYKQNNRNPNIGVTNSHEYFNEQLRRLGLDQNTAAKMWQQVLLFRRMFQDMGSSVFVDSYTFKQIDSYALDTAQGELYQLPKALRLGSFNALQKFEVYLDAVTKRTEEEKNKLTLPTTFLPVAEVSKKAPELVEKRYLLEIAQTDKVALQGNIGVKESWNWEVADKGWNQLVKQFPEIGAAGAKTRDERFAVLDDLDDKTRFKVDAFARGAIVDEHPEWLENALQESQPTTKVVSLHAKGGSSEFAGLQNGNDLMVLLDAAPLASTDKTVGDKPSVNEASKKLSQYSADGKTYYRIAVIDRSSQSEILSFEEALQQGVLEPLLNTKLEAYYLKIREENPKDYQRDDKSWKPLADVKDKVAEKYFENVLKSIRAAYAAAVPADKVPQQFIVDYAATLRLFPYMRSTKEKLLKNPALIDQLTASHEKVQAQENTLSVKKPLADQWKIERNASKIARSSPEQMVDKTELFSLSDGSWTNVNTPANGDLNFFHMDHKGVVVNDKVVDSTTTRAKRVLSDGAQQQLMVALLTLIQAKHSISLEYLNVSEN